MPGKRSLLFALFLILTALFSTFLHAQINSSTLTVYLDCRGCNDSFVRSEISYVNFVRDQSVAEVQLLVTTQGTGSGGRQYTLEFFGLGEFENTNNKLIFISSKTDTDELRRNKLIRYINLGLINYLSEKDVITDLEVVYVGSNETAIQQEIVDPWNGWNFDVEFGFDFSGEQKEGEYEAESSFRARRISENWKVRANYDYSYKNKFFIQENSQGEDSTAEFITTRQNFSSLIAKSLSNNWTAGAYIEGLSSTEQNYDLQIGIAPSIEYSIFPYSEFTRRSITFRYGILAQQNYYTEPTTFSETEEFLLRQDLDIQADFTQPWGSIFARLQTGNYLHDFSKNSIEIRTRINMRVNRSFSFFVSGRYRKINDQLSTPLKSLTQEEILLGIKQQATSYTYGGYVGIEFNFGSIYDNVVNSRL